MISAREKDREKLEGSLLTVCTNCMDMVKQVGSLQWSIFLRYLCHLPVCVCAIRFCLR